MIRANEPVAGDTTTRILLRPFLSDASTEHIQRTHVFRRAAQRVWRQLDDNERALHALAAPLLCALHTRRACKARIQHMILEELNCHCIVSDDELNRLSEPFVSVESTLRGDCEISSRVEFDATGRNGCHYSFWHLLPPNAQRCRLACRHCGRYAGARVRRTGAQFVSTLH